MNELLTPVPLGHAPQNLSDVVITESRCLKILGDLPQEAYAEEDRTDPFPPEILEKYRLAFRWARIGDGYVVLVESKNKKLAADIAGVYGAQSNIQRASGFKCPRLPFRPNLREYAISEEETWDPYGEE